MSRPVYLSLCACVCVRWWSCGWHWIAGRGRSGFCCLMGLWSRPPRRCGMMRGKSPRPGCWARSKLLNTSTPVPRNIRVVNLNRWAAQINYLILYFILDTLIQPDIFRNRWLYWLTHFYHIIVYSSCHLICINTNYIGCFSSFFTSPAVWTYCAELKMWVWWFLWSCWASHPLGGCSPSCCMEVGESRLEKHVADHRNWING